MATTGPLIAAAHPPDVAARLTTYGTRVLRYGTAALLLIFGALKFTEMEARGIEPLIGHHPLMTWLLAVFGLRGASAVIGVIELAAALLMFARRWQPRWSAVGSLIATLTFAITLSFLFTTPGAFAPDNPLGGFLMKDLILLGAALLTAGEALAAAR